MLTSYLTQPLRWVRSFILVSVGSDSPEAEPEPGFMEGGTQEKGDGEGAWSRGGAEQGWFGNWKLSLTPCELWSKNCTRVTPTVRQEARPLFDPTRGWSWDLNSPWGWEV